MNKFFSVLNNSINTFVKDEEGAQIVEYALIIAVVSIALVLALQAFVSNTKGFAGFISRVTTCLTGTCV